MPRKRRGDTRQHEKALIKFYDAVIAAILRHVNFEVVKCVLIASPGFTKDLFFDHMMAQAQKAAGGLIANSIIIKIFRGGNKKGI